MSVGKPFFNAPDQVVPSDTSELEKVRKLAGDETAAAQQKNGLPLVQFKPPRVESSTRASALWSHGHVGKVPESPEDRGDFKVFTDFADRQTAIVPQGSELELQRNAFIADLEKLQESAETPILIAKPPEVKAGQVAVSIWS